jgi:hypothetical protein
MNAEELVKSVIENHRLFKRVGRELEALPPDEHAARQLLHAYQEGTVEPWLTAYLLGCIGHTSGYDTAKAILLDHPGLLAESYAGVAMARMAGRDAHDDLRSIMLNHEHPKTRRGAAYGLAHLREPTAIGDFIEAYTRSQLRPRREVASHIAECRPSDSLLIALLKSPDVSLQKLGLAVVEVLLRKGCGFTSPGPEVAECILSLLNADALPAKAAMLATLREWLNTVRSESPP